jgi:hypothetical protein
MKLQSAMDDDKNGQEKGFKFMLLAASTARLCHCRRAHHSRRELREVREGSLSRVIDSNTAKALLLQHIQFKYCA